MRLQAIRGTAEAARESTEGGPRLHLHGKDHLVDLPLKAVLDVQLSKQVHHVGVSCITSNHPEVKGGKGMGGEDNNNNITTTTTTTTTMTTTMTIRP